ncbi:hypothetical protein Tco_1242426 [Tanacetum coccineum]
MDNYLSIPLDGSRMKFYMENRENGRMILDSVQNGPLVWPTVVQEDGNTRKKTYSKLSATKKLQADCDCKATNIVTNISQKDKNKAKRIKPSTGMEKAWEIEVEGVYIFKWTNPKRGEDPRAMMIDLEFVANEGLGLEERDAPQRTRSFLFSYK